MDLLDPDEEDDDDEEERNNQQTGKYSLRERKPPIQRFSLYGNDGRSKHLHLAALVSKLEQPRQKRKTIFYDEDDERPSRRSRQRG